MSNFNSFRGAKGVHPGFVDDLLEVSEALKIKRSKAQLEKI
jgi:hypothetical protein